mgnify:CR=1 FL=1
MFRYLVPVMTPFRVVTFRYLGMQQEQVGSEIAAVRKELKKSTTILQMDDLKCKKRVLRRYICMHVPSHLTWVLCLPVCMLCTCVRLFRCAQYRFGCFRLGYSSATDVIDIKGRVACEISSADELLLTEMMFNGYVVHVPVVYCGGDMHMRVPFYITRYLWQFSIMYGFIYRRRRQVAGAIWTCTEDAFRGGLFVSLDRGGLLCCLRRMLPGCRFHLLADTL